MIVLVLVLVQVSSDAVVWPAAVPLVIRDVEWL